MQKRIEKWLEGNILYVALAITFVITFLSLVSLRELPSIHVKNSDKLGHLIAYTALGVSWFYYGVLKGKKLLGIFVLLVIYGIVIEVLQELLTTYREADLYDILANTLGIILGWIIVRAIIRIL